MDRQKMRGLERNIPFDQYSRQRQVGAILDELRNGTKLKILDVGGYRGHTADFISDDVTVLDLFDVEEEHYIKGSALDMPFEDKSFDYVLSFDVLEHIPADKRSNFFDECNRVSREGIIICAPHKTPANEYAEKSLNDLYKKLHRREHPWLSEHIQYGIPEFQLIEKQAAHVGLHSVVLTSNKTQLWVAMQQAIFINSKFSLASEHLLDVNEFYNQHLPYDGGGSRESAYRLIFCAFRDKAAQQKIATKLSSRSESIPAEVEVKLSEQIALYYQTLAKKQAQLSINYKQLYEHEQIRSASLQGSVEALRDQINEIVNALPRLMRRKVKTLTTPRA